MNLSTFCSLVAGFILTMWTLVATCAGESSRVTDDSFTISEFRAPFQFAYTYGAWEKKIIIEDGRILLKELGCRGGACIKLKKDMTAYASTTPIFHLKTTRANTAKIIQLQIMDADGLTGVWYFDLPEPSADYLTVAPHGAAAVTKPNRVKRGNVPANGTLDLSRIVQYQIQGDWSEKSVTDVQISAIKLIKPDAVMLAARQAGEAEEKATRNAEAERLARDREELVRRYSHRNASSPEVTMVSLAAPDILTLTVDAQRTIPVMMSPYTPQPGDKKKIEKWSDGTVRQAVLLRDGKRVGRLQGKNLDWFFTDERLDGDPLLDFLADDAANYTITSSDDTAFKTDVRPIAGWRKTKPRDIVLPGAGYPTRHSIYLKLPAKIQEGKTYSIGIAKLNVKEGSLVWKANLRSVRSDVIHVNQIGYRPDDPIKCAFMSVWLGTGGGCTLPDGMQFSLLEDATGKAVLTDKVECVLPADGSEKLWTKPPKNYSATSVYRMDFSRLTTPGTYRVFVEGIGCSYPFEIGKSAWEKAFLIQMKGLYNQRSGVELGPPYTDFKKPRDFHPEDGVVVTRSTYDVMTEGPNAYANIPKGDTGEAVKEAWGGYHDAGDWNPRRVTHLYTTLAQLELCELYPAYFNALNLNIPPTEGVPDVIAEALFEIDCFRRLQLTNGAVPHGIETNGDPLSGEVSWLSTMHCYVLAPTLRDSWLYAAAAARAAKVLRPMKPELARVYLDSSVRAFQWAEQELARKRAAGDKMEKGKYWDAFDARNLSSLVLYDITGDKAYHSIFLQDSCLKSPGSEIVAWGWNIQSDQVFLYARMDAAKADPAIRKAARDGIIALAERSLQYAAGNAFNITQREPGRPMFAGFFSTSGGSELVRAHYLTGKSEYLKGAIQSCQFQSGCNPNNLVYTTGLGANPIQVPLELDARSSGQPAPVGLTVFGNSDYFNWPNSFWDINLQYANKPQFIWPDAYTWPLTEAYFDVWILVSANEYVIDTWAPNVLVWGYLSARSEETLKSRP